MLYELLPLRTTGMLGNFAAQSVLPHRYGDLTSGRFSLIRLDDSTFFVADHPMSVAQVFVDAQATKGWQQETRSDSAGHTWTVIVLAAPAPAEAQLSATGTGKRSPKTGALIENPADIIEDVMRIAGRDDAWWDQLRAESAAAGLRLAGSIDAPLSIGATIKAICDSAGAIWCPGMARLYPVEEVSGYVGPLIAAKVENLVVSANLDNTADVLRVYYDPDAASSTSQHYIELTANPLRYGGIPVSLSLNWLRTPSNAESVGRRALPWYAGERYNVTFDCGDFAVRPGQWRKLVAHPEWPFQGADPVIMILTVQTPEEDSHTLACTGEALVSAPATIVTGHSVALPTTLDAGIELAVASGVGTFTFNDSNGQPVFNGLASIDNGPEKRTNHLGQVTFIEKAGPHLLAWQAPGKRAQTLTVLF